MQGLSVVVGIRWRSKISSSGVLYTDLGTRAHRLVTCRDRAGPSHHCDHWTWRIVVVLGAYAYTTRLFLLPFRLPHGFILFDTYLEPSMHILLFPKYLATSTPSAQSGGSLKLNYHTPRPMLRSVSAPPWLAI
jgi:hypothetical protein